MDKKAVAAALAEIALLSELAGENPFKVRAYESGARAVLSFPGNWTGLTPTSRFFGG